MKTSEESAPEKPAPKVEKEKPAPSVDYDKLQKSKENKEKAVQENQIIQK